MYFHDPDAKLTLQLEDPFTMSSGGRHETTLNSVKTESTATEILDRNGSAIVTATPVKSSVASSGGANNRMYDAFFRPHIDGEESTDSNAFWIIEKQDASQGGPIWVGGEEPTPRVKFRHLNTGRFLYVRASHMHKAMSKVVGLNNLSSFLSMHKSGKAAGGDSTAALTTPVETRHAHDNSKKAVQLVGTVQDGSAAYCNFNIMYHHRGDAPGAAPSMDGTKAMDRTGHSGDGDGDGLGVGVGGGGGGGDATAAPADQVASDPMLLSTTSAFNLEVDAHFLRRATRREERRINRLYRISHVERTVRPSYDLEADDESDGDDDDTDSEDDEGTASAKKERKALRLRAEREGGEALSRYKLMVQARLKQRQEEQHQRRADANVVKEGGPGSVVSCVASAGQATALPLVIKRLSRADVAEAAVGAEAYAYFDAFGGALAEMRPKAVMQQNALFCEVVQRLVNFVCGRDFNVADENLDYETSEVVPARQR